MTPKHLRYEQTPIGEPIAGVREGEKKLYRGHVLALSAPRPLKKVDFLDKM